MKFKYIIQSSFEAIAAHKSRSFLTILGIVIGVAAIIAAMSVGRGASALIIGEIDQLGAETIIVLPGETDGGFIDDSLFFADLLTLRDLNALKRKSNTPNLSDIMPVVIVPGSITYRGDTYRSATTIGAEAEFFSSIFNIIPEQGTNFFETDIQSRARVAIIGSRVKEELFGPSGALGETIIIGDTRFRISGVYGPTGQRGPFNIDDIVVIPYTTAQTHILGTNEFDRFIIKADSAGNVNRLEFDVTATLRESRGIFPGESKDFTVMTQQGLIDQISTVIGILTAFLAFVVAIALVVGGIGIMNIMLVAVTERTKEIGLRKALGATRKAILTQFLWEAVILTLIGGIVGIFIGTFISFIVSVVLSQALGMSWPFVFPISAAILGVSVSGAVGLIFGLYPAKRAADKSPIEALQYE